jgi:hypothetical protein
MQYGSNTYTERPLAAGLLFAIDLFDHKSIGMLNTPFYCPKTTSAYICCLGGSCIEVNNTQFQQFKKLLELHFSLFGWTDQAKVSALVGNVILFNGTDFVIDTCKCHSNMHQRALLPVPSPVPALAAHAAQHASVSAAAFEEMFKTVKPVKTHNCECGGHKVGYKKGQAGHAYWCPDA